ncbi:hypothetical protein [Celeribacter sp.]
MEKTAITLSVFGELAPLSVSAAGVIMTAMSELDFYGVRYRLNEEGAFS